MQWLKSINSRLKLDRIAGNFKDVLWRPNCPLCKRPADQVLCKDCDRQIMAYRSPDFLQKDDPITPEIPLYSWGVYDGTLRRAIAACKYENQPQIMEAIGEKVADQWMRSADAKVFVRNLKNSSKNILIVPIPLHDNKLKSRGFNQAETIARRFCDLTALPCNPKLLQRIKDTKAQMQTKSKKEREENLSQAFTVSPSRKYDHQNVILFDDIYTTGATIREAIATLSLKNIAVRGVIVLARPQFKK